MIDYPINLNDAYDTISKLEEENSSLKYENTILKRDNSDLQLSSTRTIEEGTFTRETVRIGKNRIQQTNRVKGDYKSISLFEERGISYFDYPFIGQEYGHLIIKPYIPIKYSYDYLKFFKLMTIIKWYSHGGKELLIKGDSKSRLLEDFLTKYHYNRDKNMELGDNR